MMRPTKMEHLDLGINCGHFNVYVLRADSGTQSGIGREGVICGFLSTAAGAAGGAPETQFGAAFTAAAAGGAFDDATHAPAQPPHAEHHVVMLQSLPEGLAEIAVEVSVYYGVQRRVKIT